MGKMVMGKRFNPDRGGMIYCPFCKGLGKLFDEAEGRVDCKTCGGFGLVKKEEKDSPNEE